MVKKIIIIVCLLIVGGVTVFGLNYYFDLKDQDKMENESYAAALASSEKETEPYINVTDPEQHTQAETVAETEEYISIEYPEIFPEENPDPELCDNVEGGIQVDIFFSNMDTIDAAELMPYNAWETVSKQLQIFLNLKGLEVTEVQAVNNSIQRVDDQIFFYAVLPEEPGVELKLSYDTISHNWNFSIENKNMNGEEGQKHEIEESSINDTSQ